MFENVLHNTREAIPYIMASVYFDQETVHLQMEEIRQEIQDATYDYIVNISTTNTYLLYTADEKMNYI